jgi:hypothetical protein
MIFDIEAYEKTYTCYIYMSHIVVQREDKVVGVGLLDKTFGTNIVNALGLTKFQVEIISKKIKNERLKIEKEQILSKGI